MYSHENEMPKLEAGKHVVKTKYGFGIVLENSEGELGWTYLNQREWDAYSDLIEEVHQIPNHRLALVEGNYSADTLIWKRDPNAERKAEIKKQIEELEKELESL